jgi:large subunit ribosomal protein L24
MKLKKGDSVKVVRGKDNGKTGKIDRVNPKKNKVVVEGINQYKRHMKAKMPGQKSEIITITKALPISNVMLVCPQCKKTTRVGYKINGKDKTRICNKCKHDFI